MKTYTATFYRANPQLPNGGYITTQKIEAVSITQARKRPGKSRSRPSTAAKRF